MESLFKIIIDIGGILGGLFIALVYIGWVINVISIVKDKFTGVEITEKKKRDLIPIFGSFKEVKERVVICLILILTILSIIPATRYGSEQIGAFFEKDEYSAQYYVYVSTDKSNGRVVKVKADIYATYDKYDFYSERRYYLEKFYIQDNNKVICIQDYNKGLVIGEKNSYYDDEFRRWYVELTNEKVR